MGVLEITMRTLSAINVQTAELTLNLQINCLYQYGSELFSLTDNINYVP